MEPGIEPETEAARERRWRRTISERMRQAAGTSAAPGRPSDLPAALLRRSCPSPDEILARLPVRPRTRNVLRRYLASKAAGGAWTYGRLLSISRLGVATLLDVLEARQRRPDEAATSPSARGDPRRIYDSAVRLVLSRLPASESEIRARLVRAGLGGSVLGFRWLEDTARMTHQLLPFAVIRREDLAVAVAPPLEDLARITLMLATRAIRIAGLASARAIAQRAGTSSLRFVRRLLSCHRSVAWLDRDHDWFWFGNVHHRALQSLLAGSGPAAGLPPPVRDALARQLISARSGSEASALRVAIRSR